MQPHYSNLQNFFPPTGEVKLLFAAGVEFNEGEIFAETEWSSLWSFSTKEKRIYRGLLVGTNEFKNRIKKIEQNFFVVKKNRSHIMHNLLSKRFLTIGLVSI